MSSFRDGFRPVPDCLPVNCMARNAHALHVTVLHAAAADLFWQVRHRLTALYGCSTLRLTVLQPPNTDGPAIDIEWHRPPEAAPPLSRSRR
jgi:hypothetical protein